MMSKLLFCFFTYAIVCQSGFSKCLSPIDFGLYDAHTGVERFHVLERCHMVAANQDLPVNYKGIDSLFIEIPAGAKSIPLSNHTDFAGVKLVVENRGKNFVLFQLTQKKNVIEISKKNTEELNFTQISEIANGKVMLIIEDDNPWIKERLGYNASTIRKRRDILILKDGIALNTTIQSYNNEFSVPKGWYLSVSGSKKNIKGVKFYRTETSTAITNLFDVSNLYNVKISDIYVHTPQGIINKGDGCITIENCADVTLDNIYFDGTYSNIRETGYGVRLINLYDVKISNMFARTKWGVFGNYYLNTVLLKDCNINRFDLHCYGRDIKSVRCKFSGMYNQFASVYGDVIFEDCEFDDQIPFLHESSFNAFTPFNCVWKRCTFNLTSKKNYLMTLYGVPSKINSRSELSRKCLPNITVKNCKVILNDEVKSWYLIHTGGVKSKERFDYITDITLKKVRVVGNKDAVFELSTEPLNTTNKLNVDIRMNE